MIDAAYSAWFWGFLLVYGGIMYVLSPLARDEQGFFHGTDGAGRPATEWALFCSVFISWIFAKSVTNAANLGAKYGVVGGLAYAAYWLSIPLAGWVIYRLRTRHAAQGLVAFLIAKYGRTSALAFTVAILIRLYNEIWSNTAVVGAYYGPSGSAAFIGAALLFTAVTLLYSVRGGLRSSIVTDIVQAGFFAVALAALLLVVLPKHGLPQLLSTGAWDLGAGVDLLLVALLQVFSYPFHDPVLTDRGFITREKTMLRAFILAGALGFVCILAFSLLGVHAKLEGLKASGDNIPGLVAQSFGILPYLITTAIMIVAAGSTVDSTFASLAKSFGQEIPLLAGRRPGARAVSVGAWTMVVFALLGNLPMIAGADILKATTISGTMVMGLAPAFLLHRHAGGSPWSFHLGFWPGIVLGGLLAAGHMPRSWAIGEGDYALLLGVNVYGLLLCTALFLLPALVSRLAPRLQSSPRAG